MTWHTNFLLKYIMHDTLASHTSHSSIRHQ